MRDRINHMLLDGLSYVAIVKELATEVPGLTTVNLCRHHKKGFRFWLREQNLLASTRSRQEDAIEFSRQTNPASLNDAAVQVALVQIYDALHDFQSGDLKEKLASDPAAYARLVNTLSRLAKKNLSMQKYRDLPPKPRLPHSNAATPTASSLQPKTPPSSTAWTPSSKNVAPVPQRLSLPNHPPPRLLTEVHPCRCRPPTRQFPTANSKMKIPEPQ